MPTNRTRVDELTQVLTFNHDFFRHEEMELFVAERHFGQATEFLQAAVEAFSQAASPALATLRAPGQRGGLSDDVGGLAEAMSITTRCSFAACCRRRRWSRWGV